VPPRKWKLRINDILKAVQKILAYTDGLTADAFFADFKTLEAVLWNFAVIGEAARTSIPTCSTTNWPRRGWRRRSPRLSQHRKPLLLHPRAPAVMACLQRVLDGPAWPR
jgi:hypothetical protein